MELEPEWSDTTLIIDLLLDVQAGVHRVLDYVEDEDDDDEEKVPEEDS